MKAISEWLEAPDYGPGVELFEQFGNNSALLSFFKMGENNFTSARLYEELKKLSPKSETAKTAKKETFQHPAPADQRPSEKVEKSDTGLSEFSIVETELRQLYRERANAHSQMKAQTAPSERKRCAFRVLSLTDRIEAKLKPKEKETTGLPEDPVELIKIRNNNRAYISKNKKNPKHQGQVNRRLAINEIIETKLSSHE